MLTLPTPKEIDNFQRKKFKDALDVAMISIREALYSDFNGSSVKVTFTVPIIFEDISKFMRLLCLELEDSSWSGVLISSNQVRRDSSSLYKLTLKINPL